MAIAKGSFRAADVDAVLPDLSQRQRTYLITKLVNQHMIRPDRRREPNLHRQLHQQLPAAQRHSRPGIEGFIHPALKSAQG
jgi:hypothetical protein